MYCQENINYTKLMILDALSKRFKFITRPNREQYEIAFKYYNYSLLAII